MMRFILICWLMCLSFCGQSYAGTSGTVTVDVFYNRLLTKNWLPPYYSGTMSSVSGTETFTNKTLTGNILGSFLSSGAVIVAPIVSGTLATVSGTETFTNKTLTSPTILTPVITGGSLSGTTISTLATGNILVGSGTAFVEKSIGTSGQVLAVSSTSTTYWKTLTNTTTFQRFISGSGTYTTPTGATKIIVSMIGGGGGGAGDRNANAGSSGTATTFGTSFLTAGAGAGGAGTNGAAGGSVSVSSGATTLFSVSGGNGGVYTNITAGSGGIGGSGFFGGAGSGGIGGGGSGAGQNAATNSGAGGGGGGGTGAANSSSGGAAGGFIKALIISPASSYSYSVGGGGVSGTSGAGNAGGLGASGTILVEEYY